MSYKGKESLVQQVEDFKRPAKSAQECNEFFEEYCKKNGMVTNVEKLFSALNPIYYDFLVDYVGYARDEKSGEYVERTRSTYMKASGRFFMLSQIRAAVAKEYGCYARIIAPAPKFFEGMPSGVAVCSAKMGIEFMRSNMNNSWEEFCSGEATARRKASQYNEYYIEKAETAARARAIAAAGIGVDIAGGLSTIEDAVSARAEEEESGDVSSKLKLNSIEARIRSCKTMDELSKSAKDLSNDVNSLGKSHQQYLSDVFEEVSAKLQSS